PAPLSPIPTPRSSTPGRLALGAGITAGQGRQVAPQVVQLAAQVAVLALAAAVEQLGDGAVDHLDVVLIELPVRRIPEAVPGRHRVPKALLPAGLALENLPQGGDPGLPLRQPGGVGAAQAARRRPQSVALLPAQPAEIILAVVPEALEGVPVVADIVPVEVFLPVFLLLVRQGGEKIGDLPVAEPFRQG